MNPMPPTVCGTLLAAMMAAGISHYWSVESFVTNYPTTPAVRLVTVDSIPPASITPLKQQNTTANPAELTNSSVRPEDPNSKEFFQNLIQELRNLRNENRALTNQVAETNRDVMKMQFQIDTHAESFRPLQVSEERNDTSYGMDQNFPGVLPPRAEPVYPFNE